jgi:hypothetical protein
VTKRKSRGRRAFLELFHSHSLSLAAVGILAAWTILYARSDPDTRSGEFFGNSVADWCGTLVLVIGTKYLFETGSAESRHVPARLRNHFLFRHSLTIFLIVTGGILLLVYRSQDPAAKWSHVLGNVLSEWVQMLGIVFLTKRLLERHSKESHH